MSLSRAALLRTVPVALLWRALRIQTALDAGGRESDRACDEAV